MSQRRFVRLFGLLAVAWGALAAVPARCAAAEPMTETQKIESLIRTVEDLKDAVFIRNGTQYDCRQAAQHMRDKWRWLRDEIKTARDFIRLAASRSSVTGKPYLIRFKDGREVQSGDFLLAELDKLERQAAKGDK